MDQQGRTVVPMPRDSLTFPRSTLRGGFGALSESAGSAGRNPTTADDLAAFVLTRNAEREQLVRAASPDHPVQGYDGQPPEVIAFRHHLVVRCAPSAVDLQGSTRHATPTNSAAEEDMSWLMYLLWGAFGGLAAEGIELYGAILRCRDWPWRIPEEVSFAPFIGSIVIRVGIGCGLAAAAGESQQVSGPFGAVAVGVAAPVIIEQIWKSRVKESSIVPSITPGEPGHSDAD
jgi:hypothetical protein